MEEYNEFYKAKCIRRLKEWDAPLSGWYCVQMYDVAEEDESPDTVVLSTCELCDCSAVRYVHVMRNSDYFEDVEVGCICAGIMEGNILAAKERENQMKNRAKRKRNFPGRQWHETYNGNWWLTYRGEKVYINKSKYGSNYGVRCGDTSVWRYKGKLITDFLSAAYAAFDLVDTVSAVI